MVRFYWQVDDSCSAFVPVKGLADADTHVQHVSIDMEVPGVSGYASAVLTLPLGMTNGAPSERMRRVGVVLAHDADASSWKGELMTALAQV
jgi:hypothetical protein